MPKIAEQSTYNGALKRAERLGLNGLLAEVRDVLTGFTLSVKEEKHANGAAIIKEEIYKRFRAKGGWVEHGSGEVDWTKCMNAGQKPVCIGVEVQVSGRSDAGLFTDVAHLRREITNGELDIGVIVVPSDRLSHFLVDRTAAMSSAKLHVRESKAEDLPLILIALDHDSASDIALNKKPRTKRPT